MPDMPESDQNPTDLLIAWGNGDAAAFDRLVPLVHQELHRLARAHMGKERTEHTLQATALVNEVYLRLIQINQVRWQNRAHFFAMASTLMRRILVDFARARGNRKRGGDVQKVTLDEAIIVHQERSADVLAVDEALRKLEELDPRRSRVVELRFFGGLTLEETAEVLSVSADTVKRDWRVARMWLLRELS